MLASLAFFLFRLFFYFRSPLRWARANCRRPLHVWPRLSSPASPSILATVPRSDLFGDLENWRKREREAPCACHATSKSKGGGGGFFLSLPPSLPLPLSLSLSLSDLDLSQKKKIDLFPPLPLLPLKNHSPTGRYPRLHHRAPGRRPRRTPWPRRRPHRGRDPLPVRDLAGGAHGPAQPARARGADQDLRRRPRAVLGPAAPLRVRWLPARGQLPVPG